jgi:hypothetical protein
MGESEMIDVVCFCGNSYSFTGDAGACPQCGEVVTFERAGADGAREEDAHTAEPSRRAIQDERPEDIAA